MKIPERVFIQQYEDPKVEGFQADDGATWWTSKVYDHDVEYIHIKEYEKLGKELADYKNLVMNLEDFLTLIKQNNKPNSKNLFSRDSLDAWINTYHKSIEELRLPKAKQENQQ